VNDFLFKEQKQQQNSKRIRKYLYQIILIFSLAFFRFFLLGMLEMSVQDNIISGNATD